MLENLKWSGRPQTSGVSLVVSCASRVLLVVLAAGVVGLGLLGGCADKKVNPYTGRQASLDSAVADHEDAGKQLDEKVNAAVAKAAESQAAIAAAAAAEAAERERTFQLERGKLQRQFAAQRVVAQAQLAASRAVDEASFEDKLAEIGGSRDGDIAGILARAKIDGDGVQARAASEVSSLRETYEANSKFIRDWQREWEEERAKWTLGVDLAGQVAQVVPGAGLAVPIITGVSTLIAGLFGGTTLATAKARKREVQAAEENRTRTDSTWDEAYAAGLAAAGGQRKAADEAWDEADKRAKPDPTVAVVTSLATTLIAALGKNAPPSTPTSAGKDAA